MTDPNQHSTHPDTQEQLLHDIITPLLTSKMNAALLAEYLPQLFNTLKNSPDHKSLLPKDEKIAEALMRAPEIINNNIDLVQKKYRLLSQLLYERAQPYTEHTDSNQIKKISSSIPIKRILLVDDEIIHQDIGFQLLHPNYEMDSAKNGIEAISKCKTNSYDLILMDLQMPKMNGLSATEELRKFIPDNVIIIGLTSMPLGEKRVDLLALGFDEFLEKPLKLEQFQNLIQLLDGSDANPKNTDIIKR